MEYLLIFVALAVVGLLTFVWSLLAGKRAMRDHEQKIMAVLNRRGARNAYIRHRSGSSNAAATYEVNYVDRYGYRVKVECIVNDGQLFWTEIESQREQMVLKSGR